MSHTSQTLEHGALESNTCAKKLLVDSYRTVKKLSQLHKDKEKRQHIPIPVQNKLTKSKMAVKERNEVLKPATTWVKRENTMRGEKTQTQRTTFCMSFC